MKPACASSLTSCELVNLSQIQQSMAGQHKDLAAPSSLPTFVTKPKSLNSFRFPHNCSTHTTFQTHTRLYPSWTHPTHHSQIIPLINGNYFSSSFVQTSTINPITTYSSSLTVSTSTAIPSSAESSQASRSSVVQTLYPQSVASSTGADYATWSELSSSVLEASEITLQSTTTTTSTPPIYPTMTETLASTILPILQSASQTTFTTLTTSTLPSTISKLLSTTSISPSMTSIPPSMTSTTAQSILVPIPSASQDMASDILATTTIFVIPTEASAQSTHQQMMPASKTIAIAASLGAALAIAIGLLVLFLPVAQHRQKAQSSQPPSPEMTLVVPSTLPSHTPNISKPILLPAPQLPQVIRSSPVKSLDSRGSLKSPDLRGSLQTANLNPAFLMPPSSARSPASLDSWGTPNSATSAPSHLSYDSSGNIRRSDPFNLQHIGIGATTGFGVGH